MHTLGTTFIFLTILLSCNSFKKISTFWHVSDIFWKTSSSDNCTLHINKCLNHSLNILLERSSKLHPDFILWSSSGGPYFTNVVTEMKRIFKSVIVLPSLLPGKLPASKENILYYQNMSDYFSNWLDDKAFATFWKAGYYSKTLDIPRSLQIIVLNTAFFCNFHIASKLNDPADQWSWLTLELIKARNDGKKVYLLLSATPGITDNYENKLFTYKHNRRYITMVQTFSDIIKAQFGGFEDGDKFHIFYDKKGRSCGWLMLAPPFCRAIRLYFYDIETVEPIDYVQFYYKQDNWHLEYRFIDHYSVPNISTHSLERIAKRMEEYDEFFSKYIENGRDKKLFKGLQKFLPTFEKSTLGPCTYAKSDYRTSFCRVKAVDYHEYIECISTRRSISLNSGLSLKTSLSFIVILSILIKIYV